MKYNLLYVSSTLCHNDKSLIHDFNLEILEILVKSRIKSSFSIYLLIEAGFERNSRSFDIAEIISSGI